MIHDSDCSLCKYKWCYEEQSFSIHRTISKFLEPVSIIFVLSFILAKIFNLFGLDFNAWIISVVWYSLLRAIINYLKNFDRGQYGDSTVDRKRPGVRRDTRKSVR